LFIGNDIVDLTDPATRLDALNDSFTKDTFTDDEYDAIFADRDPGVALWSHWAAKQSVIKALVKAAGETSIDPRALRVDFYNRVGGTRMSGSVEYAGHRIDVDVVHISGAVHAVAMLGTWPHRRAIVCDVVAVPGDSNDAGGLARGALCSSVADRMDCPLDELCIVGADAPRIERDGIGLGIDVSLSHHGRLAAFAHTLPRDAARGRVAGSRPRLRRAR
jgi:phosphopantetheinyl transferase (holo-ACP synthase)